MYKRFVFIINDADIFVDVLNIMEKQGFNNFGYNKKWFKEIIDWVKRDEIYFYYSINNKRVQGFDRTWEGKYGERMLLDTEELFDMRKIPITDVMSYFEAKKLNLM